jgi:hypothetical protein
MQREEMVSARLDKEQAEARLAEERAKRSREVRACVWVGGCQSRRQG